MKSVNDEFRKTNTNSANKENIILSNKKIKMQLLIRMKTKDDLKIGTMTKKNHSQKMKSDLKTCKKHLNTCKKKKN